MNGCIGKEAGGQLTIYASLCAHCPYLERKCREYVSMLEIVTKSGWDRDVTDSHRISVRKYFWKIPQRLKSHVKGAKWRIYQLFPLQTCLCIHNCILIGWRCVWVSLRGVYVRGECLGIFPWSLSITHDGQNKWVFPAWAPQFQTSYIKYILDLQTGHDKTPLQLSQELYAS